QGFGPGWPDLLVGQTMAKQREYQDNVTVVSVTIESEARAAVPRTVLLAPPPPSSVGVPMLPPELPKTVMLPMEPSAPRMNQAPPSGIDLQTQAFAVPPMPAPLPPPMQLDGPPSGINAPPFPAPTQSTVRPKSPAGAIAAVIAIAVVAVAGAG